MTHLRALKSRLDMGNIALLALVGFMAFQTMVTAAYRSLVYVAIEHSEVARELLGVTPFRGLVVTRTELTPDGLLVWGQVIKLGCKRASIFAYTKDADGTLHFAVFASQEDTPPPAPRPALPWPQAWGPMLIRPLHKSEPIAAAIVVALHDCPDPTRAGETLLVTTTALDVPWATDLDRQPQEPAVHVLTP